MKKMIFALCTMALFTTSCNQEDATGDCTEFQTEAITDVTEVEPDAATPGRKFKTNFTVNNGCGKFGSFEVDTLGNTYTISLIAKYEGCVCDMALHDLDTVYHFNQTTPGTYTLKFRQQNDNFITKTVEIE